MYRLKGKFLSGLLLSAVSFVFAVGFLMIPSGNVNADENVHDFVSGQVYKIKQHETPEIWFKVEVTEPRIYSIRSSGHDYKLIKLYASDKTTLLNELNEFNFSITDYLTSGTYYYLVTPFYSSYGWDDNKIYMDSFDDQTPVVNVSKEVFPDDVFRQYINDKVDLIDDDILTRAEIDGTAGIFLNPSLLKSVQGLEYFPSLKMFLCFGTDLESLDVSNNKKLEDLQCIGNNLTSLDLSNNKDLKVLDCSQNKIESLDVSMCPDLADLTVFSNPLTELNMDGCNDLMFLSVYRTKIKSLDLNCPELLDIDCYEMSELELLDVSRCTSMRHIDGGKNPKLTGLYLPGNQDHYLNEHFDGTAATPIYLTPEDWTMTGITWVGDELSGYKGTFANYQCTKAGATDYKKQVPMQITKEVTLASCEEEGKTFYIAKLSAFEARDGKDLTSDPQIIDVTAATGHKWGAWTVTKKATVTSEGEETRVCKKDPTHKETRKIAKLTPTATPTKVPSMPTAKPTAKATAKPTAKVTSKPSPKVTAKPTAKVTAKPSPKVTAKPTAKITSKPSPKVTANPTKAPVITLTLDKSELSVVCGKTSTLKATLKGVSSKITWKSSDTKVAKVDANGKITAKMAGSAVITASAAGKSTTCQITVLYKDVTNKKNFWYTPTNYMTAAGVVKGYDKQTLFKPANKCTRAQMVTFIWRLMGEPEPKAKTCKFSDVKTKDYFYKACIWGNEKHIVEGYKDGTFGPQIVCARRHAVTFLWRLANKPSPKSKENKFKDVKKSDYFYTATLWASEKGILAGYSDGTFRPNGDCLRRQMVTFLYKYDKFVNKKG